MLVGGLVTVARHLFAVEAPALHMHHFNPSTTHKSDSSRE